MSLDPSSVKPGMELEPLEIPVSRTVIVAGAIATQDFEDVHHDPTRAIERGTPETYLSINNTNGFITRYVADRFGAGVRITLLRTRLGVPHFAGNVLRITGTVDEVTAERITLTVSGRNDTGVHTHATVEIEQAGGRS